MKRHRDEIIEKQRRRHDRSLKRPIDAIALNCIECMGGTTMAHARQCENRGCFLWPHAPAGRAKDSAGDA